MGNGKLSKLNREITWGVWRRRIFVDGMNE